MSDLTRLRQERLEGLIQAVEEEVGALRGYAPNPAAATRLTQGMIEAIFREVAARLEVAKLAMLIGNGGSAGKQGDVTVPLAMSGGEKKPRPAKTSSTMKRPGRIEKSIEMDRAIIEFFVDNSRLISMDELMIHLKSKGIPTMRASLTTKVARMVDAGVLSRPFRGAYEAGPNAKRELARVKAWDAGAASENSSFRYWK